MSVGSLAYDLGGRVVGRLAHRKLWPLFVAHALLDFGALGIYIVQVMPV